MLNSYRHRGVAGSQLWLVPGRMALACAVRCAVLCGLSWPWPPCHAPERRGAGGGPAAFSCRWLCGPVPMPHKFLLKTTPNRMKNAAGSARADFTSGMGFLSCGKCRPVPASGLATHTGCPLKWRGPWGQWAVPNSQAYPCLAPNVSRRYQKVHGCH